MSAPVFSQAFAQSVTRVMERGLTRDDLVATIDWVLIALGIGVVAIGMAVALGPSAPPNLNFDRVTDQRQSRAIQPAPPPVQPQATTRLTAPQTLPRSPQQRPPKGFSPLLGPQPG